MNTCRRHGRSRHFRGGFSTASLHPSGLRSKRPGFFEECLPRPLLVISSERSESRNLFGTGIPDQTRRAPGRLLHAAAPPSRLWSKRPVFVGTCLPHSLPVPSSNCTLAPILPFSHSPFPKTSYLSSPILTLHARALVLSRPHTHAPPLFRSPLSFSLISGALSHRAAPDDTGRH